MSTKTIRETDKALAEAMGWGDWWQDPKTRDWYGHPADPHIEDDRMQCPRFSSDESAAMDLWRWLRPQVNLIDITTVRTSPLYDAAIIPGNGKTFQGEGITIGLALGNAVLKWLESKAPDASSIRPPAPAQQ